MIRRARFDAIIVPRRMSANRHPVSTRRRAFDAEIVQFLELVAGPGGARLGATESGAAVAGSVRARRIDAFRTIVAQLGRDQDCRKRGSSDDGVVRRFYELAIEDRALFALVVLCRFSHADAAEICGLTEFQSGRKLAELRLHLIDAERAPPFRQ